jgi:homoserine kinase
MRSVRTREGPANGLVSANRAIAFAPAAVGNVAVGFDVLGFAVEVLGDRVTATRTAEAGVRIAAVRGAAGELPREPERNTAGRACQAFLERLRPGFGLALELDKGIPLASGLGGSAASAVAAVVAANALLERPLAAEELFELALAGEAVATGGRAFDNVAPSLFGGLVLTVGDAEPRVRRIPVPAGVRAVIVHPRIAVVTREARALLRPAVPLADFVTQSANLAGFVAGCYTGDVELLRATLRDVVIEPQRAGLIPGFAAAREAALAAGAIGCSISGAGPATFAWALERDAEAVRAAMCAAFVRAGHALDHWIVPLESPGARVVG